MTDSAILERVGSKLIGRQLDLSDLRPDLLNMGVTCAILNISGKIPSENILLNIFVRGKEIGVATIEINFPGRPQLDAFDFLMSLHNFATSM